MIPPNEKPAKAYRAIPTVSSASPSASIRARLAGNQGWGGEAESPYPGISAAITW